MMRGELRDYRKKLSERERERERHTDRQRQRGGWGNLKKEQQDIGKKEISKIRNERNT